MKRGGNLKRSPFARGKPLKGFTSRRRPTLAEALWRDARDAALERDNWSCQGTGSGLRHDCDGTLEVHHILPRGRGGTHHLANLVTLCRTGHQLVHSKPRVGYRLGLLQRSGDTPCTCGHVERLHSVTYGTCTFGAYGMGCTCRLFTEAAA